VREDVAHGDDAHEKDAKPQELVDARFRHAALDGSSPEATVVPDRSEPGTSTPTRCLAVVFVRSVAGRKSEKMTGGRGPVTECHGPFCPSLGGGPLL